MTGEVDRVDATLKVNLDTSHVYLRWRFDRLPRVGVEVCALENTSISEAEVEPVSAGNEGGLESGSKRGIVRQIGLVEEYIRYRSRDLLAFLLLNVDDVYLPSSTRSQGLNHSQAHATSYISRTCQWLIIRNITL